MALSASSEPHREMKEIDTTAADAGTVTVKAETCTEARFSTDGVRNARGVSGGQRSSC
jgi:hypothetical protein